MSTGATGPSWDWRRHLLNRCRIQLNGASDGAIQDMLFEVFHEFFNDSSSWQEIIPFMTVLNTTSTPNMPNNVRYYIAPNEQPAGQIIRLVGIFDPFNVPVQGWMNPPGTIQLQFSPSSVITYNAIVVKNVDLSEGAVPQVPLHFIAEYEGGIVDGVIAKMMMQKNRPYTDVVSARSHYAAYRNRVNEAKIDMMRNNTFGSNAWSYPQQYRSNGQRGSVSVGNITEF